MSTIAEEKEPDVRWRVRFFWRDSRGLLESGWDISFPARTTALMAIIEVANMRGVDVNAITSMCAELL